MPEPVTGVNGVAAVPCVNVVEAIDCVALAGPVTSRLNHLVAVVGGMLLSVTVTV